MIEAGVVEDDDCVVVAFQDTETGAVVEFQYGEPDEQDIALGMTGVCVVVNGGAATCYQAVSEWSIEADQLTVVLTEKAARVLMMDPVVLVVDLSELRNRLEVEAAVRRVLAG